MKTITLQSASILAIKELSEKGSFSAYDVTTLIRSKVDTEYDVSDVENYGTPYTEIVHADVKKLVEEMYENGIFEADKSQGDNKGFKFIKYTPKFVYPVMPSPPRISSKTSYPNTGVGHNVVITTPTPVTPDPVVDKINTYLGNKGAATIKQIQSAVKVGGLTCEGIAKILGIKDDSPSKVVVKNYGL